MYVSYYFLVIKKYIYRHRELNLTRIKGLLWQEIENCVDILATPDYGDIWKTHRNFGLAGLF